MRVIAVAIVLIALLISIATGAGTSGLAKDLQAVSTPTPAPTPTPIVNQDWRPVDTPNRPTGKTGAGFCLHEELCWFVDHTYDLHQFDVGTVHVTRDRGVTWEQYGRKLSGYTRYLFFLDELRGFTERVSTNNGGKSWQPVKVEGKELTEITFVPRTAIGYGCQGSKMFKTLDGGERWLPWPGICPGYMPATYLDESIAWANKLSSGGPFNVLAYTVDAWQTWREIAFAPEGSILYDLDFVDYWHGWTGGATATGSPRTALLYKTADAGQTWRQVELPTGYREVYSIDLLTRCTGG